MRTFRRPLQERVDMLVDSQKVAYIDSLESLAIENPMEQLAVLRVISQYHYHSKEYGEALHWVNREFDHLKTIQAEPALYDDSYFRKGDIFFDLQQYELAFKEYFKGLETASDLNEARVQGNFNHRLGQLSYRKQDFAKALTYFKKSLNLFNQLPDQRIQMKYRRQELCSNIGLCYWRMGELEQSIAWFDSALAYIGRLPHRVPHEILQYQAAKEVALGNQGIALYEYGEKERGMQQMKNSLRFNSIPNAENGHAAFIANEIARFLINENRLAEAKHFIDTSKFLTRRQPISTATLLQEKTYLQYFLKTGNIDSLSVHLANYMAFSDSLKDIERGLLTVNTDQLLAGLEKDFALRTEIQKSQTQERINSILLVLLGTLLSGLAIIGWMWQKGRRRNQVLARLNQHVKEQNMLLEKAQREQLETNDRLEQLNRQKDKLLRVVAHDLRNPLAAIYGLSGIMLEDDKNEHDREFLELANQACRGGLDLIGELLDPKQGEKSSREIFSRRERINAEQFLNDTLRLVKHRADEKEIKLQLKCEFNQIIYVDLERLRRALTNLIVNAIKFSKRGGLVEINCTRENDKVVFEVRDFGIGIPADHLPRLFESFTTYKRAGTEGEKPFGLGLSITRQIAEEHQGEVQVESTEGVGSVFRLTVPATLPENN